MKRNLFDWLFGGLGKRFWKPRRHTIAHHRLPCATCGRTIAHTQAGKVYPHKCIPQQTVDMVRDVEREEL